jgi:hypothetical protein
MLPGLVTFDCNVNEIKLNSVVMDFTRLSYCAFLIFIYSRINISHLTL